MLIFSLIFYAWAGPAYLLLLIGMTFADWVVALQMSKNWERPARKRWLVIGCVINIGLLCIFKYTAFFLQGFTTGLVFRRTSWSSPCPSASVSTPSSC